ncbi:galactokinase, partial [Enterococcus faecalis]
DDWPNYPKGVLNYLIESRHNIDSGLDVLFYGRIPNGAGLSSSASIELLMGTICNDLYALHSPMLQLVQIGRKVENEFIG